MGATSIEKFHDIVAITFELQTFPDLDEQDKFIVTAANRDDIFEFEFEGPHLVDVCRNAGILTSWEKDQKIREFEEKVREKDKKIGELEKDNKNLTEAYASMYESVGRALREQQRLKEEYEEKIRELQEKIFHLEALKTPTIENFTVEEISDQSWADNVNHPSHYTGRYECIDVMQDVFGDEATDNFCLCNAFKYIWRARKKNGLEDVKKAVWYLNKYIEEAEKDGVRKWKQI